MLRRRIDGMQRRQRGPCAEGVLRRCVGLPGNAIIRLAGKCVHTRMLARGNLSIFGRPAVVTSVRPRSIVDTLAVLAARGSNPVNPLWVYYFSDISTQSYLR